MRLSEKTSERLAVAATVAFCSVTFAAVVLTMAMALSLFAGCASVPETAPEYTIPPVDMSTEPGPVAVPGIDSPDRCAALLALACVHDARCGGMPADACFYPVVSQCDLILGITPEESNTCATAILDLTCTDPWPMECVGIAFEALPDPPAFEAPELPGAAHGA